MKQFSKSIPYQIIISAILIPLFLLSAFMYIRAQSLPYFPSRSIQESNIAKNSTVSNITSATNISTPSPTVSEALPKLSPTPDNNNAVSNYYSSPTTSTPIVTTTPIATSVSPTISIPPVPTSAPPATYSPGDTTPPTQNTINKIIQDEQQSDQQLAKIQEEVQAQENFTLESISAKECSYDWSQESAANANAKAENETQGITYSTWLPDNTNPQAQYTCPETYSSYLPATSTALCNDGTFGYSTTLPDTTECQNDEGIAYAY